MLDQEDNSCLVAGHLLVYFFLSAFVWMTLMSFVIFNQIYHGINPAGGGQSLKFLLKNMTLGYGAPFIIVLMMIVTEVSVENCSKFHPRFGQRHKCLFGGFWSKFVWLLCPILILLLINTGMFIYVCSYILKNRKMSAADSLKSGKRKEMLDRICLYLRLFLGMGSIWYFEIISSFIGNTGGEGWSHFSIVPDLINAMQGVWVFITFVCKRNVIQVITMKKDRLYSAVMNRSRSGQNKDQRSAETRPTQPTDSSNNRISRTEMISLTSLSHHT